MQLTKKEKRALKANKYYWAERNAKAQTILTEKNIKQLEKQVADYYANTIDFVIRDFELTYAKLLSTVEQGKQPTPADLYKLDKYWHLQAQLRKELDKLGNHQIKAMSNMFIREYKDIYDIISLPSGATYNQMPTDIIEQMINAIWCNDGKSWKERIWTNTSKLQEALNEGLIECLLGGKTTKDLKWRLRDEFGVSFGRADALVRTEMSHIQNQAARQRYLDAGCTEYEILADKDERQCEVCGKLHGKRVKMNETLPIPAHPRCRCSIIPVIE